MKPGKEHFLVDLKNCKSFIINASKPQYNIKPFCILTLRENKGEGGGLYLRSSLPLFCAIQKTLCASGWEFSACGRENSTRLEDMKDLCCAVRVIFNPLLYAP